MIYPLTIPLIFITLSSWRALVKVHAQRDLFDRCAGRIVEVEGLVVERRDSAVRIAIHSIECEQREIDLNGEISAYIRTKNTGIRPGDSVAGSIICTMYHPHNGLFYGREVGIGLSYQERPPPTSVSRIVAQSAAMHAESISVFEKILSPNAYQLVGSLLLGKAYEKGDARDHAKEWGILHLLARSGLHLALIFWILRKSLALLPCKPGVVSAVEWHHYSVYHDKYCIFFIPSSTQYGGCRGFLCPLIPPNIDAYCLVVRLCFYCFSISLGSLCPRFSAERACNLCDSS